MAPSVMTTRRRIPGLVPYEELSEAEKDYDRQTALETLKAVRALGYGIVPPEDVGDLPSG